MIRQGDVLLVPIQNSDLDLLSGQYEVKHRRHRRLAGLVLAEGEATGHHHRVVQKGRTTARIREYSLLKTGRSARVLTVPKGGAELVHDEHDTIQLDPGKYLIQGQREYVAPAPKEAPRVRRVVD